MKLFPILLLALLATACTHGPGYRSGYGYDGKRGENSPGGSELICHKGKTMELPSSAVGGHLGHGDYRGRCR